MKARRTSLSVPPPHAGVLLSDRHKPEFLPSQHPDPGFETKPPGGGRVVHVSPTPGPAAHRPRHRMGEEVFLFSAVYCMRAFA